MMAMEPLHGIAEITDPHHHLWDLGTNYYPWLTDRITQRVCGEYSAIRKNYLLADFLRDVGTLPVVRTIHVQAEHDSTDPVRETAWLQSIAGSGQAGGLPHGIVAYADLRREDAPAILEAHATHANLRGIRQMLHEVLLDPGHAHPALFGDPAWQRNLGLLRRHGLSFDLQIYPQQADAACALLARYPETTFVLCHAGQPARQDDEAFMHMWRASLHRLAAYPNLSIKLSGFGMFDRRWTPASIRPLVLHAIDAFGPERTMFASNFPVDGMASSYDRLWKAYGEVTGQFSAHERQALFSGTARRVYRV